MKTAADDKTYCQSLPISVGGLCQDITLLQVCPSRNPLSANLIFVSFSQSQDYHVLDIKDHFYYPGPYHMSIKGSISRILKSQFGFVTIQAELFSVPKLTIRIHIPDEYGYFKCTKIMFFFI